MDAREQKLDAFMVPEEVTQKEDGKGKGGGGDVGGEGGSGRGEEGNSGGERGGGRDEVGGEGEEAMEVEVVRVEGEGKGKGKGIPGGTLKGKR